MKGKDVLKVLLVATGFLLIGVLLLMAQKRDPMSEFMDYSRYQHESELAKSWLAATNDSMSTLEPPFIQPLKVEWSGHFDKLQGKQIGFREDGVVVWRPEFPK